MEYQWVTHLVFLPGQGDIFAEYITLRGWVSLTTWAGWRRRRLQLSVHVVIQSAGTCTQLHQGNLLLSGPKSSHPCVLLTLRTVLVELDLMKAGVGVMFGEDVSLSGLAKDLLNCWHDVNVPLHS